MQLQLPRIRLPRMNKIIGFTLALLFTGNISSAMASQKATPIYQVSYLDDSSSKNPFIQVPLTYDIYRYARYSDLRDLRLLDAEHNPLPYQLVSVAQAIPEEKIITDNLRFFPVAVDANPDTLRRLHTRQTNVSGDHIQIATSDKLLDNKTPEFYLIDIREIDHAITSFGVEWDEHPANQYVEIELEATNNLQNWTSLGRTTLIQLTQQGQKLKHNQIHVNIDKKEYEFLRLKILRGAEQLNITRVEAHQKIKYENVQQDKRERWSITGQLAQLQTNINVTGNKIQSVAAWEFIRDEVTPAQSLSVNLGSNVYGDVINVFSRNTEKQEWGVVYQGIWFNAQVGETWQSSEAIRIYPNDDKFWRIEFAESAKGFQALSLMFSWQPLQLQIIANNKPPFSLAISTENNVAEANQQVFRQIIASASAKWVPATLIKLEVIPEIMTVEEKVDWKRWIFWAALVAAVIVLLIFSLRLFRQLKVSDIQQ